MEITLDTLCKKTRKAEVLNALHACRPNHPLGKQNEFPWRNALFVARQQPSWVFDGADIEWLEKQNRAEPA